MQTVGLSLQSGGQDSGLSVQGARAQFLGEELRFPKGANK